MIPIEELVPLLIILALTIAAIVVVLGDATINRNEQEKQDDPF